MMTVKRMKESDDDDDDGYSSFSGKKSRPDTVDGTWSLDNVGRQGWPMDTMDDGFIMLLLLPGG